MMVHSFYQNRESKTPTRIPYPGCLEQDTYQIRRPNKANKSRNLNSPFEEGTIRSKTHTMENLIRSRFQLVTSLTSLLHRFKFRQNKSPAAIIMVRNYEYTKSVCKTHFYWDIDNKKISFIFLIYNAIFICLSQN